MLLIWISCSWVLGIFLGSLFQWPPVLMLSGLLPFLAALILPHYRMKLVRLALGLILCCGAAFYFPHAAEKAPALASYNQQGRVEIYGKVSAPPESRDNLTHLEVAASAITAEGKTNETRGTVLLFLPRYPEYRYGDILVIKGKLEAPPVYEGFDYQAYLSREGIFSTMFSPVIELAGHEENRPLSWVYSWRSNLSQALAAALPEPQAGLAQGIFLGIRSTLPDSLKQDMSVTGTAHLIAISGINLTIVAGVIITLGVWLFGRRYYIYIWLALCVIWLYAMLTGLQAPVIRAAIMASVFLCCDLLGRQKNAMAALAASAALMVGISPDVLWTVSFQLSFLAMAGLILLAPPIQDRIKEGIYRLWAEGSGVSTLLTVVTDSLCVTLAAVIAVWPVITFNFGTVSVSGPLATLLLAPALTPIIFSAALTAITGLVSPPAARIVGWIAWLFLSYMLWLINVFAGLAPASLNSIRISSVFVWTYYIMLALLIWAWANRRKLRGTIQAALQGLRAASVKGLEKLTRTPKKFIIIPLLFLALMTSLAAASIPDRDLHVSILDVGEGEAILVRNGSQNILIDGGPSPQPVLLGLGKSLPFWDRKLDLVVLTHSHLDHLGGMIEVLRDYQVDQVLAAELSSSSAYYRELNDLIKAKSIRLTSARAGQQIALNSGSRLEVLNPAGILPSSSQEEMENDGIVLRLVRGKISFLLTTDIGPEAENELVRNRSDLACTVLKVAHHGSVSSSTTAFLAATRPQAAVISAGAENRFGHPSAQVIDRLKDIAIPERNIFRTDRDGSIEFTTDGWRLWVKTER
jgi:competence protein ComEC